MSPDTSAKLAALPGVKEAAEEMAREAHNLFARLTWSIEDGWGELDDDARATLTRVHITLLCDLTRRPSLDWWAAWLAERKGAKVSGSSPAWELVGFDADSTMWTLTVTALTFGDSDYEFDFNLGADLVHKPREALAAACLAVGGAS